LQAFEGRFARRRRFINQQRRIRDPAGKPGRRA
jgi:hypothetical protein